MNRGHKCLVFVFGLFLIGAVPMLRAQGPPYQTDDPVPVDYKHYEFYIFGAADGTPVEMDSVGPAFEFNWGALPRVQLHAILPWGSINPSNNPVYYPAAVGPQAFGLTDMELGAKIATIKESKYVPQIGTFTMFEMPTGNYDSGLGVGKVWYRLPLWLQKNIGPWLLDGAPARLWFRRPNTAIFLTVDFCSSTRFRATGWSLAAKYLRMARKASPHRRQRLPL